MILTAKDISQRLADKVDSFVQWLLPNGKRDGAEWCCGSVGGEAGKSLKVHLIGQKAGVWCDFAGDEGGDLLDLIVSVRQVNLAEAIKIAREWLGLADPQNILPKKIWAKPAPKNVRKPAPSSPVVDYLKNKRKLDEVVIKIFKVSESTDGKKMAFPSFARGSDELVNVKYISIERGADGKKIVSQEKGCAPILFGWQAFSSSARSAVICEGQIDAMTWKQAGFDALSVPDGTANDKWVDLEWDNLQQLDTIWLAYDDDEPGQKASQEVAKRLGLHRCLIVKIPGYKDANDALQAGAPTELFRQAINDAKAITPESIKAPLEFLNKVQEKFYPPAGVPPGFWPTLFKGELGLRPGEVTTWSGISGHGKSILLNEIMLEAVIHGNRVAIGSFEMLGEQTLHKMIIQSEICQLPTRGDIGRVLQWLSGRLWIYDLLGNVAPKQVLELMEYSHSRHGVTQFVIDSLMKCSVGSEDYDAQRIFLNDLCAFAKDRMVHINLVAHARKGRDESEQPGKLDIKGSSDIINQTDNIVVVWRNKEKEQKKFSGNITPDEDQFMPDAIAYCHKQRETGVEFERRLSFFKKVFRFCQLGTTTLSDLKITNRIKAEVMGEEYHAES
jgi:twinkle protein